LANVPGHLAPGPIPFQATSSWRASGPSLAAAPALPAAVEVWKISHLLACGLQTDLSFHCNTATLQPRTSQLAGQHPELTLPDPRARRRHFRNFRGEGRFVSECRPSHFFLLPEKASRASSRRWQTAQTTPPPARNGLLCKYGHARILSSAPQRDAALSHASDAPPPTEQPCVRICESLDNIPSSFLPSVVYHLRIRRPGDARCTQPHSNADYRGCGRHGEQTQLLASLTAPTRAPTFYLRRGT
jgi:hypothetical protein